MEIQINEFSGDNAVDVIAEEVCFNIGNPDMLEQIHALTIHAGHDRVAVYSYRILSDLSTGAGTRISSLYMNKLDCIKDAEKELSDVIEYKSC